MDPMGPLLNSQDTPRLVLVTGCCGVSVPLLSVLEAPSAGRFRDNKL